MIISIENSTSSLSLALLNKDKIIDQFSISIKNDLSEIIIPTIKNFLIKNTVNLNEIFYIAIGCGPGSFTGIRTVISAAKGIKISNNHINSIGINSLAGLAMSVLEEAKANNIKYIISSIDTKRGDAFIQLFKLNFQNQLSFPFLSYNDIQPLKLENLNSYILKNNIPIEEVLFVGHQYEFIKNTINNLKISINSDQKPNATWIGKFASHFIYNKINFNNSKIINKKFKAIYVRVPEIYK